MICGNLSPRSLSSAWFLLFFLSFSFGMQHCGAASQPPCTLLPLLPHFIPFFYIYTHYFLPAANLHAQLSRLSLSLARSLSGHQPLSLSFLFLFFLLIYRALNQSQIVDYILFTTTVADAAAASSVQLATRLSVCNFSPSAYAHTHSL